MTGHTDDVPPIIIAAREFLTVTMQDAEYGEKRLAHALDRIALASHDIPEGEPAGTGRVDTAGLRALAPSYLIVREHFPELGIYAVVKPSDPIGKPSYAGDAIDDVTDLMRDMLEAVWRFDRNGASDACWFLCALRFHWERHLRELALYLHTRRCG